jgi:hypothetical protein
VILVRIVHVPVGEDQTGHGVENFWGSAGIGVISSYVKSRTLTPAARSPCVLRVAGVIWNSRLDGRDRLGKMGGGWLGHISKVDS